MDFMAHINDTRDQMPGIVVKNPTPEELSDLIWVDMQEQIQGKPRSVTAIDFRQPQKGLTLRTFKYRHPKKNSPLNTIINTVFDYQTLPDLVVNPSCRSGVFRSRNWQP